MTPKHILLTTDLSEESLRAFESVSELARALQARVTLLHVVRDQVRVVAPVAPGMPPLGMDPREAAREARQELDTLAARLPGAREVLIDAPVGQDVARAIVDYATKHEVDFIAMATHGHSGIKRLLLGSTAESVARSSPIPVILYPPAED